MLSPTDERDLTQFLCDEVGAKLLLSDVAPNDKPSVADDPLAVLPDSLPGVAKFGLEQVNEFVFWLPELGDVRTMRDADVPNSAKDRVADRLTKKAAGIAYPDVIDFARTPSLRLRRSTRMSKSRWAPGQFGYMRVNSTLLQTSVKRLHAKTVRWLKKRGTKTDPFLHCPEVAERRPRNMRVFWVWVQPDAQIAVSNGLEIWPWNA